MCIAQQPTGRGFSAHDARRLQHAPLDVVMPMMVHAVGDQRAQHNATDKVAAMACMGAVPVHAMVCAMQRGVTAVMSSMAVVAVAAAG